MRTLEKLTVLMTMLPMVFLPQLSWAQVSKPKKEKRVAHSQLSIKNKKTTPTSDLQAIFSKMAGNSNLGELFDRLAHGIDHKNREHLLMSLKKQPQWKTTLLPQIDLAEDTVKITVNRGSAQKTLVLKYVLNKEVYATINGRPILVTEVENPHLLINRVEAIVKSELGQRRQASFLWRLLLPQADAFFSFGLSTSGGFISKIFSMIMMYRMMKLFSKDFSNGYGNGYYNDGGHYQHHHRYYPYAY